VHFDSKVTRRDVTKTSVAIAGAALAAGTLGAKVYAQEATPATPAEGGAPGLPPLPEGATVVAQGLFNPRGLYMSESGTLYIAEVGVGGDEVLTGPAPGEAEEATPVDGAEATPVEEAGPPSTRGYTGQITAVAPDGTQTVIAEGLASYSDLVGPSGVAEFDGSIYFTVGGSAPAIGLERLDGEGWVGRVNIESGELEWVADLGQYEIDNNPDGTDVNPNLFDIVVTDDAGLYVNDAGGNVIYNVDPVSGEFAPVAILPLQGGLPEASTDPAAAERQVVPTGLAKGDDGTIYASFLGEFWPADAPSIVTVASDGTLGVFAKGLQALVDITTGPDGNLYATVLTTDFENFGPGQILRVNADGTTEVVVDGVFMPQGIAFDPDGNLYIVIFAMMSGPGAPAGQVIRIDGIATPAA
jgi:hypothetical protein